MRESGDPAISRSADGADGFAFLAAAGAVALVLALVEAFGTGALPIGQRVFLFGAVIGVNAAKWHFWRRFFAARLAPRRRDWLAASLGAALLFNLTLPLELELAFRALGRDVDLPWLEVYGLAVLLAMIVASALAMAAGRREAAGARPPLRPDAAPPPPAFLLRAGVSDPSRLIAMEAEDHYVRLHLADGRRPLVLQRFGDAVAALQGLDGQRVHRCAWAAADAVEAAFRDGRKWRLRLRDGTILPVSDRHLAALRARGWLR